MNKTICLLIFFAFCLGCTSLTPREKEISKVLNKTINLEIFDTLRNNNSVISYKNFRKKYNYFSIIYLQESCSPCYHKYKEWVMKIQQINASKNYTMLFIIQGYNYNSFIKEIKKICDVQDTYYIIMDPYFKFVNNNSVPFEILDESILIDSENKIRMVGAPWANEDMTKLFHRICKE